MMAQEREAVEDAVVIALSKLTNLLGRLPSGETEDSLCTDLMRLAETDIRHSIFQFDEELLKWALSRWSLLHLSPASFTEETFVEITSDSCAEIQALPSCIGDGTSSSSNLEASDIVPFRHLLGSWVKYQAETIEMHNGHELKKGQRCEVIEVSVNHMKLRGEGMGGAFKSGFGNWACIPKLESDKKIEPPKSPSWQRCPPITYCLSCRHEVDNVSVSRVCSKCQEQISRNRSDDVMKVTIEESGNPRVKIIYSFYGADKISEGCRIEDIDKNVEKRRNTKAYRNAQKRLEAYTRLNANKVKGGSSSRRHEKCTMRWMWQESAINSIVVSIVDTVGTKVVGKSMDRCL